MITRWIRKNAQQAQCDQLLPVEQGESMCNIQLSEKRNYWKRSISAWGKILWKPSATPSNTWWNSVTNWTQWPTEPTRFVPQWRSVRSCFVFFGFFFWRTPLARPSPSFDSCPISFLSFLFLFFSALPIEGWGVHFLDGSAAQPDHMCVRSPFKKGALTPAEKNKKNSVETLDDPSPPSAPL